MKYVMLLLAGVLSCSASEALLDNAYSINGMSLKIVAAKKSFKNNISLESDQNLMVSGSEIGKFMNVKNDTGRSDASHAGVDVSDEEIIFLYGEKGQKKPINLKVNVQDCGYVSLRLQVDQRDSNQMRVISGAENLHDAVSRLYESCGAGGGVNYVLVVGKSDSDVQNRATQIGQSSPMGMSVNLIPMPYDESDKYKSLSWGEKQ